ncbi:11747_t:CDS:10, partial [Funneliformis mosseae]
RQYAKDFTRDKLKEHRKYTKELDKIISNNESKEKCAQAQKCLNEFDPVTVNRAFPRGIDYASISMLQLGTASFWLLDWRLVSWNISPNPLIMMISFGYLIRLIYYLFYKDEKSSPEVEAFWISDSIKLTKLNYAKSALDKTVEEAKEIRSIVSDETISTLRDDNAVLYVNTPESKRVLDRDCESDEKLRLNVEEMGFDEYVDRNDIPFIFKTKNISSLFESYRSKALAHAQNSGLIMTKNYHEVLSLSHILLLQRDNYSESQVKTFSRETLEDLRKDIKSKLIGKEKVSRDIKSILQEYIEVALDDNDGGLHELRETITESFSKEFNSTEEKEFFRRMKFLFKNLSYTIPLHPLKEIISEGTLVANIISPILRIFFHDSYIYPTIWPNTSSTSAKVRKLAIGDPTRAKQPDMIGKIVNNANFVYETMFGEDSLDNISRKTGVNRIFSFQVIVTKWTGYMMTLISPGIYVMIDIGSVDLPRSFEVCNTFLTGLDTLFAFQIAYEKTIKDILSIMNKSEEFESNDNFKGWRRSTL